MNKRFFAAIITAAIMLPMCPIVNAQADIQIGDYVQMGNYEGSPILWRCIDIDENGPLMLSDKILCFKEYDAPGKHETDDGYGGRKKNGSNRWSESNLRCWLNSDKAAGETEWLCGNKPSYDDEAGFLTNFSEAELNSMKEVTHKSVLDENVDRKYIEGGELLKYDQSSQTWQIKLMLDVIKNFDTLYYENVTEKMSLLDAKQFDSLANSDITYNGIINYRISTSAQNAMPQLEKEPYDTEYKYKKLNDYFYLRTPAYVGTGGSVCAYYVYCGYYAGGLDEWSADSKMGVRPAFYFDSGSDFAQGDGSRKTPYIIKGASDFTKKQFRAIPTSSKIIVNGKEVSLTAYNINDNNYFRLRDIAELMNNTGAQFSLEYDSDNDIVIRTKGKIYTDSFDNKPLESDLTEKTAQYSSQIIAQRYYNGNMQGFYYFPPIKAYSVDGYNYCKLRDLAEYGHSDGFNVQWDGENNVIYITTKE